MSIGEKVKNLRLRLGLTQEELGARTELSKGFISQLERDITSPSIATLMDILEALGTDVGTFFSETRADKIVYSAEEMFIKEEADGSTVRWLVTDAQRNAMEPILVTLPSNTATALDDPHEGEEFGYVLTGSVTLELGERRYKVTKGDGFYFRTNAAHRLINSGKVAARVLWVSTPPNF